MAIGDHLLETNDIVVGAIYNITSAEDEDILKYFQENAPVKVESIDLNNDQYPIRVVPVNHDDLEEEGISSMKDEGSIGIEAYELTICRDYNLGLI